MCCVDMALSFDNRITPIIITDITGNATYEYKFRIPLNCKITSGLLSYAYIKSFLKENKYM